ncbi:MAG: hypothetical protein Q7J06_07675 [Bacteroidales bacterium]|nr:hypothetical protein [Bacteroidales bacterium]
MNYLNSLDHVKVNDIFGHTLYRKNEDIVNLVERLAKLKEQGIIDDIELAKKKKNRIG